MRGLLLVAIIVAVFCVCDGKRKHGKDQMKLDLLGELHKPNANPYHVGSKHHRGGGKHHGGQLRGKHLNLDDKPGPIKSVHAHDHWMEMPVKSKQCKNMKCAPKHFCITHPKTGEEKCINRRNFRQIRRMFKSFHQQKLKQRNGNNKKKQRGFEKMKLRLQKLMDTEDYKHVHEYNFHENPRMRGMEKLRMRDMDHLGHKKHADFKHIDQQELVDLKKRVGDNKHGSQNMDVKSILEKHQDVKEAATASAQECRPHELYELRRRLVGWFVMLHTESRQHHHHQAHKFHKKQLDAKQISVDLHKDHHRSPRELETESHGHCKCSKSVMWEFRKQDIDQSGHLSHDEIANLEANKREPCMKPLLKSCDHDKDGRLAGGEFCCCLADNVPPCEEKKRLSDAADWVPLCDKEGYYLREQYHKKSGYRWCVDLNGNPITSKTLDNPHCGKYDPNGHLIKE